MYISASIAAAILLTPVLGSLYPRDTYGSLYARNLDPRDAYFNAIYAREAGKAATHHVAAPHAAAAHPPPHAAAKHAGGGIGHALSGALGHAGQVTDGMNTASELLGSGGNLMQQFKDAKSSFGNGADSNGAAAAAPAPDGMQRRSIYADPDIYERDFDDLHERDFEGLDERDLEDLYERDLEGLDERGFDDLSERDIYDLYERGFGADFEDMYE